MRRRPKPHKPLRKRIRSWITSLVLSVLVILLVQSFVVDIYFVRDSSMEAALLPGDLVVTNKLANGPRLPITPLAIPFLHQYVNGSDGSRAYSPVIQLPYIRIPGWKTIERNEVITFNQPTKQEHPISQRTFYTKRCIAIPGDTLLLTERLALVNGDTLALPPNLQHSFLLTPGKGFDERYFGYFDITAFQYLQKKRKYLLFTTTKNTINLESLDEIKKVVPYEVDDDDEALVFGATVQLSWNSHEYGPLMVPKAGQTIDLTPENVVMYGDVIRLHEGIQLDTLEGRAYIDGLEAASYTFEQNYYFVLDDNRDNANDSRYWGFVPESHIVGKAWIVLTSVDPGGETFMDRIRFNRFLVPIF